MAMNIEILPGPVFSLKYFQWMALDELHAREAGEYSENLFRWLTARRDYPFDQSPEPESPSAGIEWIAIRRAVFQEFRR